MASCKVLLFCASDITSAQCNSLNTAIVLPSLWDEDIHYCVLLTNHFLAPRNDVHKTFVDHTNLIWFTVRSYLEDEQGHYQAGYAATSIVNVNESSYLPEI